MTWEVILPYVIAGVGGFLASHFNVLGTVGSFLGLSSTSTTTGSTATTAAKTAATTAAAPATTTSNLGGTIGAALENILTNHPILQEGVTAAIKQFVSDEVNGKVTSLKSELVSVATAAAQGAVSGMQPAATTTTTAAAQPAAKS